MNCGRAYRFKDEVFYLQTACGRDLEAVARLQKEVLDGTPAGWFCPTDPLVLTEPSHGENLCLWDEAHRLAGYMRLILSPLPEENLAPYAGMEMGAVLDTVFVAQEYRGRGIQLFFLEEGLRRCRERGVKNIFATVHPDNRYSRLNFEKAGFELVKIVPKYGSQRAIMGLKL